MVQFIPQAETFRALADPVRCAIIARLAEREGPIVELAAPFAMTLQGVRKHIDALEAAGLIHSEKEGRSRICRLQPQPLTTAARWLDDRTAMWHRRLDNLERIFAEEPRR